VYAMKTLRKDVLLRRGQLEHTRSERLILQAVNHPFIVSLKCAFQTPDKLYLVTDFCSGGELFFWLKRCATSALPRAAPRPPPDAPPRPPASAFFRRRARGSTRRS